MLKLTNLSLGMRHIFDVSGTYLVYIWGTFGTKLRNIWDISVTYLGHNWDIFSSYLKYIWYIFRTYLRHVRKISGIGYFKPMTGLVLDMTNYVLNMTGLFCKCVCRSPEPRKSPNGTISQMGL